MLVLSRRPGERILIGDDITITVVRIGRTVRLGIDAPRDKNIVRAELADQRKPTDPKAATAAKG